MTPARKRKAIAAKLARTFQQNLVTAINSTPAAGLLVGQEVSELCIQAKAAKLSPAPHQGYAKACLACRHARFCHQGGRCDACWTNVLWRAAQVPCSAFLE